jgi:hypothetical protein
VIPLVANEQFGEDPPPISRTAVVHTGLPVPMMSIDCSRSRSAALVLVAVVTGCQPMQPAPVAPDPALRPPSTASTQPVPLAATPQSNPAFIPFTNQDWAWEQIVDVVDDYFRIERERPVQLVGNVLTEGQIDTYPQVGATVIEPQRPDSAGTYNRWESTLQTIRRRATVRIIPAQGGYLVGLEVQKELEDLPRPEHSTAGAATFRNDSSLPSRLEEKVSETALAGDWILVGRDAELERQMLCEMQEKVAGRELPLIR